MKKHLIAAAVAGALAVPAMAQVTMYGNLEVGVGSNKTDGKSSTTKMVDSTVNTSRLGFKGSEDLGGGLKAIWGLEARLDPQTGGIDDKGKSSFFERGAYVGLSGGFGTLKLGKLDHQGTENNDASLFGNVGLITGVEFGSDENNTIAYSTPKIGGFSINLGHTFKDNGASGDNTHDGITSYQVSGNLGPASVKIGGGEEKELDGSKKKVVGGSIRTDLGMAKVSLAYQKEEPTSGGDETYTVVNVSGKLGGSLTGYGVFGKFDVDGSKSKDFNRTALGLGYSLSKRTTVYALHINNDYGTGGADVADTQILINHKF